jgi:hypothetical protein
MACVQTEYHVYGKATDPPRLFISCCTYSLILSLRWTSAPNARYFFLPSMSLASPWGSSSTHPLLVVRPARSLPSTFTDSPLTINPARTQASAAAAMAKAEGEAFRQARRHPPSPPSISLAVLHPWLAFALPRAQASRAATAEKEEEIARQATKVQHSLKC